jgi:flagellar biosynthetic protein FliR
MPDFLIPVDDFVRFILVFFRIGSIFVFAPFFNHRVIPARIKIAAGLMLSLVVFPLLSVAEFTPPKEAVSLILAVIRELMIGLVIGFTAQLFFAGVQYAGELISVQMGFGLAMLIDPTFDEQNTVVSQMYNLLALLIFIALSGHHFLIRAAVQTFEVVPLSGFHYTTELGAYLLRLFANIFLVAFRIGAPVLVALFVASIAMGLVNRAIPQMNIFMISPPLQIIAGVIMMIITLRATVMMFKFLFTQIEKDLQWIISHMAG